MQYKLNYKRPMYNGKENTERWNVFVDGQNCVAQVGYDNRGRFNFYRPLPNEYGHLRKIVENDIYKIENKYPKKESIAEKCQVLSRDICVKNKKQAVIFFKSLMEDYEMWDIKWKDEELFSTAFFKRFGTDKLKSIYEDLKEAK